MTSSDVLFVERRSRERRRGVGLSLDGGRRRVWPAGCDTVARISRLLSRKRQTGLAKDWRSSRGHRAAKEEYRRCEQVDGPHWNCQQVPSRL